jgi:hypothetical protein
MAATDTGRDLKYRFKRKVVDNINNKMREQSTHINAHPIVYSITCCNHFFERVIERDIDKGKLGSIFIKLLEEHYCEILYYFLINKSEIYRTQHNPDERHCIKVSYKGIGVIFLLGIKRYSDAYDNQDYEIITLSIINNENRIKDTVLDFDLNPKSKNYSLQILKGEDNVTKSYITG